MFLNLVLIDSLNSEGGGNARLLHGRVRATCGGGFCHWLTSRGLSMTTRGNTIFDQSSYMEVNIGLQLSLTSLNYNIMTVLCFYVYARKSLKNREKLIFQNFVLYFLIFFLKQPKFQTFDFNLWQVSSTWLIIHCHMRWSIHLDSLWFCSKLQAVNISIYQRAHGNK